MPPVPAKTAQELTVMVGELVVELHNLVEERSALESRLAQVGTQIMQLRGGIVVLNGLIKEMQPQE